MKLYYSKGACSLAPHIILEELGLPYEALQITFGTKDANSEMLEKLNPLGAVPVLVMDNEQPLTEVAAILQYLADLRPEAGLAPGPGTLERTRLQEKLNFIATEVHKGFSPLFGVNYMTQNEAARADICAFTKNELAKRFEILSQRLGQGPFLMGSTYSIADAYLFTILNWSGFLGVDLSPYPNLVAFMEGVKARPATQSALKAERLI